MSANLRCLLEVFKNAPPGERFKRLYYRRESRRSSVAARSCFLGTGLAIMGLGVLLMPAPGPGTIVLIIGAAVAAQESLRVARAMDWCDVRLTSFLKRALRWWRVVS